MRRSEARIGGLETRLREMETRNRRFEGENARLRESLARDAQDERAVIDRQAAMIETLRKRLETRAAAQVPTKRIAPGAKGKRPAPGVVAAPMIQEFETGAGLAGEKVVAPGPRPLSSWLPAGSYAEAVVLAGVDASVGVSS